MMLIPPREKLSALVYHDLEYCWRCAGDLGHLYEIAAVPELQESKTIVIHGYKEHMRRNMDETFLI